MTQTTLLIIILVLAVLLLIISMRGNGYLSWHKRGHSSLSKGLNMDGLVKVADEALGKLNCEVTWKEEDSKKIATFDYQNGHFSLYVSPGSPYVRLGYFFCFNTSLDSIHTIRTVCNQCNMNSDNEKVVYSVNEKKNEADIHVITGLLLHPENAKDVLADAMAESFSWQSVFARRFREMEGENGSKNEDLEMKNTQFQRELFLLRQQEIRMQGDESARISIERVMCLDTLLDKVMGITEIVAKYLVVDGEERKEYGGHENIMQLDLVETLGLRSPSLFHTTTMTLGFEDPRFPGKERLMTITINAQGEDRQASYYRFTLCLIPLPISPETPFRNNNEIKANSLLVACDKVSTQQLVDESNYMWKEALEKVRNGETDSLTEEQRLICECTQANLAQQLYIGKKFFLAGRYYEALPRLEMVFHDMNANFDKLKNGEREAFFEVCYLIGFAYVELKQYDRAMNYLDMVSNQQRITYTEEMINCMVNSGDFRSLNYIESLINNLQSGFDPNDEDYVPEPHILKFLAFLKRRKVFVLVEKHRFDEAKTILNDMLDDPENVDYAINELAYIQKIEKNTE